MSQRETAQSLQSPKKACVARFSCCVSRPKIGPAVMNVDQELARCRYSRLVFTYSLLHIQDDCLRAASDRNMGVGGAGKDRTKWTLSATNGLPVRYVPAILH